MMSVLSFIAGLTVPTRWLKRLAAMDGEVEPGEFDSLPDTLVPPAWLHVRRVVSDTEVRVEVWLQDRGLLKMSSEDK